MVKFDRDILCTNILNAIVNDLETIIRIYSVITSCHVVIVLNVQGPNSSGLTQ